MNTTVLSNTAHRGPGVLVLFTITLFFSAALMFSLQPMFGKILLPLLGGSPAVWNTCMVFYQIVLFLGYLYAHYLSSRITRQRQIVVHAAVILISFIALPLGLPENSGLPTDSDPTLWLVWTLGLAIGLPFFIVSTTAPLLQKWFAGIGHHTSHDPYYLYAASNAGSLLALLGYLFLIEPNIGLTSQKNYWGGGYFLLCVLIIGCAVVLWRSTQENKAGGDEYAGVVEALDWSIKLRWMALAFVPSSLLLGLTNFISTDIASVPLLWIIPLTLFLLSFILVFSSWGKKIHHAMVVAQPVVLLPFIAYSFINPAVLPYWLDLCLHLLAFFLAIMVCHGELAKSRPHTKHLTAFYLLMSLAGMLGGMFNTFIAPFIFNAVYEYPIMIVGALLLRPGAISLNRVAGMPWWKPLCQVAFPLALLIAGLLVYAVVDNLSEYLDSIGVALILLAGLTYAFRSQPLALALLTGVSLFFSITLHGSLSKTLYQERSFFGVSSVRENTLLNESGRPEAYHELFHGTTLHGAERLADDLKLVPLTYYSRPGPMGQLFKEFDSRNAQWTIGAVGLGAGALTCYAKPGQSWTLYEIDPLVIKIASDPNYFRFVPTCGKSAAIKAGDARLSIAAEPEQKFDLLIMDAFSSDAVPTHLLTREAMQLYFSKLKADGLLAFHITNRHLAIKKVLSDHARRLNLAALVQEFKSPGDQPLVVDADWLVLAKSADSLALLANSRLGVWQKPPLYLEMKPWTDDFTNILEIWK